MKQIEKLRKQLSNYEFKCKEGCFSCCRQINFTKEERDLLSKDCPDPPRGKGNVYCEYLTQEGRCSVYMSRPIICRAFGVVDIPMLTCKYTKPQMPFTKELREYSKKCTESNECCDDVFLKKVSSGDLEACYKVIKQLAQLHVDGILSLEEFRDRLMYYDEKTGGKLIKLTESRT